MSSTHYDGRLTPTTILAAVNLLLVVFGGGAAWSSLTSEQSNLRQELLRIESEANEDRAVVTQYEIRLRAVEFGAGRMEQQLQNIASGVERLNVQMDRIINQYQAPRAPQ